MCKSGAQELQKMHGLACQPFDMKNMVDVKIIWWLGGESQQILCLLSD